jgi:hypothetical protein
MMNNESPEQMPGEDMKDNRFYREPAPQEVKIGSMYTSAVNDKILPAFQKALSEMEAASKESKNEHFRSKYADLSSCLSVVKPALATNKMSLSQAPELGPENRSVTVHSTVFHESGQYIRWTFVMPLDGPAKAHEVGKSITYARRYALAGVGIMTDEDDDGNSGSGINKSQDKTPPPRQQPPPPQQTKAKPVETAKSTETAKAEPAANNNDIESAISKLAEKNSIGSEAIKKFLTATKIAEQPDNDQLEFIALQGEEREYSKLAQHWGRTGKTFRQCLDEAKKVGPAEWVKSLSATKTA